MLDQTGWKTSDYGACIGKESPTPPQTKRWVIPKGNLPSGLAPHDGAAKEALEEAGVTGAICPVPLGTFRYRKRKGSGASLMADVEVFPLAVNKQLDEWPEKDQRQRLCSLSRSGPPWARWRWT